MKMLV